MRNYIIVRALYWIVGLFTGCIFVSFYQRTCERIRYPPNKQFHLLSAIRQVGQKYEHSKYFSENLKISVTEQAAGVYLNHEPEQETSIYPQNPNLDSKILSYKVAHSEWLDCKAIYEILQRVKSEKISQYRKENADGNKSIFFTTILNKTGHHTRVVVKHATIKDFSTESEVYRYTSAQREIDNLRKLKSIGWKGIPDLHGACVKSNSVTYVVTQIIGQPLCTGNGTDQNCAMAYNLRKFIEQSKDPGYSTVLWLSKAMCFFKQFEEHKVFMEDFSGINFYFSPDTLDLFIVDADSLVFYGDVRINSRSSCRDTTDCSRPNGNLWRHSALNHKIYYSCREVEGYCYNNTCRGYDSSLHACGVGRWLISPLRNCIPLSLYNDYIGIAHCLMELLPQDRCSMTDCCLKANSMLKKLQTP